ncbi:MAG TPA: cysteine synthase A [Kofleriaceae bacterium]|nr:cysteine synthase A [Kofleriaceae bacterium]
MTATAIQASRLRQVSALIELMGKTPLCRLNRVIGDDAAEVWVKCEQYNPGGSVKDRVALAMIEAAERDGLITPGVSSIVEPTSGNTGIGLALVCAAKGYHLILTMPESMSLERRALLASYGAEIVLTPDDQTMAGAVKKARELAADCDHCFMPDQFTNPANPEVHRRTTAPEILEALPGPPHAFVSAIGTGGTITGVGRVLRERYPKCEVIGVEPASSAVIAGQPRGPHKIQGIGAGFIPPILDQSVITSLTTVADDEAHAMAKRLCREEGLLVGISSGANVVAAREAARRLGPGFRVVTVLCDTGERYFSLDEYFS